MAKTIKVMAEYTPNVPIWWEDGEQVGFVDPAELGLPGPLIDQFLAWNLRYRSLLNRQDPASTPNMGPEEQRLFEADGLRLARELSNLLGSQYDVLYFSHIEHQLVEI